MLETSTTFKEEYPHNIAKGLDEVHEAEEVTLWRVQLVTLNENWQFWIPYHQINIVWAFLSPQEPNDIGQYKELIGDVLYSKWAQHNEGTEGGARVQPKPLEHHDVKASCE